MSDPYNFVGGGQNRDDLDDCFDRILLLLWASALTAYKTRVSMLMRHVVQDGAGLNPGGTWGVIEFVYG